MMEELLRAAVRVTLSAGVMVLAVLLLRVRFQERTPRRVFCLLWDIVLVRLLVLAEIPSPVSIRLWLPGIFRQSTEPAGVPMVTHGLTEGTAAIQATYVFSAADSAPMCCEVPNTPPVGLGNILAALWLAAALTMAGWFLWNHLRSRRIYAASLPVRDGYVLEWLAERPLRRPVRTRYSDRIASPLTYGVAYPVILLPSRMDWRDREALSCVLSHEYEHIRRFDALRKGLLALALCLHWFNPLVWCMYVLAGRDIELSCDEAVVRAGADREGYALALLSLEERRGGWSSIGSHFSQNALEERIKTIMKHKHFSLTALVSVLLVMAVTTTVFASAAPENKETSDLRQDNNAPIVTYVENEKDASVMMSSGETGEKLFSVDGGETWMSEERYHAEYGNWGDDWQVEWWTYEEYKEWLEQEKKNLQEIIGSRGWTPSTGWFTWDQKRVNESIALYEEVLEDIKNGALYSRTVTDKDGNEVEGMLGSNAPLETAVVTTCDEGVLTGPTELDTEALLKELKDFGIGGDENHMTYNGQLIRTFVDGAPVGKHGYSTRYVYTNNTGDIDVHTLRSVIHNPDGSYDTMGDLIGVAAAGDPGFDQKLIDSARFTGGPEAVATQDAATNGSGERGQTFEEIFARYTAYGLVYQPRESGMGALIWNGQPVRSFADLNPGGGAFSYSDPYMEEGLAVHTEYDQDGRMIGLAADPAQVKGGSQEKREFGFDYCIPVKGTLSSAFGPNRHTFHYGVDLAAEKGADVMAFAGGTASEVGFDSTLGNYVVLSHTNGYSTLYAHCSSITVPEGSSVAMGEKIAEAGASGQATGAALHFELRQGDTYLDPAQYLDGLI